MQKLQLHLSQAAQCMLCPTLTSKKDSDMCYLALGLQGILCKSYYHDYCSLENVFMPKGS